MNRREIVTIYSVEGVGLTTNLSSLNLTLEEKEERVIRSGYYCDTETKIVFVYASAPDYYPESMVLKYYLVPYINAKGKLHKFENGKIVELP